MKLLVMALVTLVVFTVSVGVANAPTFYDHPKPVVLPSRGEDTFKPPEPAWIPFVATWYSGSGGSDGGRITKSGTVVANNRTVAVDPNVIPLGSLIEVKFSDGTIRRYVAEDTGGAIVGNRIDIFNSDTRECYRLGRQDVQVRIIRSGR